MFVAFLPNFLKVDEKEGERVWRGVRERERQKTREREREKEKERGWGWGRG